MSIQASAHDLQHLHFDSTASPSEAPLTRSERWFNVARVVLGLLLLSAAVLKLSGMNVTALPRVGWFSTPRVQVAAATWEMVLGLWLLSGLCRAGAWLAATGTLIVFAGVSGYLGWTGIAICGCFGVIKASPWLAFGVDVAALALLAGGRPNFRAGSFRLPTGAATIAAAAVAVLVALTGVSSWLYGSPQGALARLRGDALTVSSDYVDFGSGSAGQELKAAVDVQNWTDRPVRLVGGSTDCSCLTTSDLPLTIPPGEARPVTIRLKLPGSGAGALTRVAEIWTDLPSQRRIRLRVGGHVVK